MADTVTTMAGAAAAAVISSTTLAPSGDLDGKGGVVVEEKQQNCTVEFNSSFLQHASGQAIAGLFAWAAIFVTCHQVIHIYTVTILDGRNLPLT